MAPAPPPRATVFSAHPLVSHVAISRVASFVPPLPLAQATLKVRETTVRRVPVLGQGSAHKRKPKRAVGKMTVRRVRVLRQGSACARGRGATNFYRGIMHLLLELGTVTFHVVL